MTHVRRRSFIRQFLKPLCFCLNVEPITCYGYAYFFFYCLQNETWNFRGRVSVGQMRVIHRNFPKNDRTRYTTKRNRVKRSNKNELQKIEGGDVVKPQKINNNVKASTPNQLAVGTPACVNKCSLRKLPNRYLFPLLHRFLLSRNSALLAFSMFSVFK